MQPNKAVVKFKDGKVTKGRTSDFFPNKAKFHLEDAAGQISEISVEDLKALFFVKDFDGDSARRDDYADEIAGGGRKIEVKFADGETVVGYTLAYSPDRQGFFVTPADLKGNNERVFVVKSATEKVAFI